MRYAAVALIALAACSSEHGVTGPVSSNAIGSYTLATVDGKTIPAATDLLYDPSLGITVAHTKVISAALVIRDDAKFVRTVRDSTSWLNGAYTQLETRVDSGAWHATANGIVLADASAILLGTDLHVESSTPYGVSIWVYHKS